jgi:transposase
VETAFRSLKTDLGTRPIYHQGAERTSAHLFISVLAYNLLTNIEYRLREKGDSSSWNTIKNKLSTHQRTIMQWEDENGNVKHKKSNSTPETSHKKIYKTLGIKNPLIDFTF